MESQLQRPHDNTYDDPHNLMVEDEGENHHEKKSVLKKVKAKAKKIKDTLTKHGHGHEHEHEHDYHHESRDDDEEDEDEDEEMVEDPEIHGAPVYESSAIRSTIPNQGTNLEKPTTIGEDRFGTKSRDHIVARPGVPGQEQYFWQSGLNLEKPTAREIARASEDKNVSFQHDIHGTRPSFTDKNVEKAPEQGARIGELEHLKEDPNYARRGTIPPSNYETKLTNPTGKGGDEAHMTPLIQSLDKVSVSNESVHKPEKEWKEGGYTERHDQFAPQSYPTADEFSPGPLTTSSGQGTSESIPRSYEPSKYEELPRDTLTGNSADQSGYIEKISTSTSAITDKAISAKNIVASKLGYGGTEGAKGQEMGEGKEKVKLASPTEYAHKVAVTVMEKLAPVYEKVADAGSSVTSKVRGSTTPGNDERPEVRNEGEGKVDDKGVSMKEYLTEKLKPSDEDKALSEVISETLHKKKDEIGKTKESKPMEKVTESEEVARRLGSGKEQHREGDDAIAAGSESSGKGVVERIKDAVNLWVAKGGKDHQPEGSPGSLGGDGSQATGEVEERRFQESAN